MASGDELLKLKERVAALQKDRDKATGALEQVAARIKKEFGCATIEAAKGKLRQLTTEADAAERKFDKALAAFKEKHKDLL